MSGYGSFPNKADAKKESRFGGMACGLCNCMIAVPQDRWYAVEKFEQNICVVETKTKDNVFVAVHIAVQQSVVSDLAKEAIYKLSNVDQQIDSYVADVVRSHVPKMDLDEVFENKDAISNAVTQQLKANMKDYGFEIHKALVTELKPSADVMAAMNEITKQRRLRDAEVQKAEAEKIKVVVAAEAHAESARLQGEGIAAQRSAIVEGLRKSITAGTDETLTSEKISELLLISQYFETLRDIGANSKAQAIFIPTSPGQGIADIAGQIRGGIMQAEAAGIAAPAAPAQAVMS